MPITLVGSPIYVYPIDFFVLCYHNCIHMNICIDSCKYVNIFMHIIHIHTYVYTHRDTIIHIHI